MQTPETLEWADPGKDAGRAIGNGKSKQAAKTTSSDTWLFFVPFLYVTFSVEKKQRFNSTDNSTRQTAAMKKRKEYYKHSEKNYCQITNKQQCTFVQR